MLVGLLTQSQTVACWILVVFAWGLGFACAVVRGTFDVRPVLSAQIAMLALLGAASVAWPEYPGAGPGEAARVVMWLPMFGLFVVELKRANLRNSPLLGRWARGTGGRVCILAVHVLVGVSALMNGSPLTAGAAYPGVLAMLPGFLSQVGGVPVPLTTRTWVVGMFVAGAGLAFAWKLSPSARPLLPPSARGIAESYVNFVLPPDYSYSLSAEMSEADARQFADDVGVPWGPRTEDSGADACSSTLEWKPPRLTYEDGCW